MPGTARCRYSLVQHPGDVADQAHLGTGRKGQEYVRHARPQNDDRIDRRNVFVNERMDNAPEVRFPLFRGHAATATGSAIGTGSTCSTASPAASSQRQTVTGSRLVQRHAMPGVSSRSATTWTKRCCKWTVPTTDQPSP